jgi:glycosyltransferase involved in cell wall biosynthesis
MPAVANAPRDWPLAIVGDGPERGRLERDAAASGRDVRFTGWLPRQDVLRWIAHAELLVFPSRGPESLSRVLLEAAAQGTPIAAMAIIVDRQTGLLSTTAAGLAAVVATLAGDPATRARLSAAGRAHVERTFSSVSVVRRIIGLYEELTSRRPRAQSAHTQRRHA